MVVRWISLIASLLFAASTARGEIVQWFDGDGDGSLWLSDVVPEPYINLDGAVLWWADLPGANLHTASLRGVNLMFSKLEGANLSVSDLSHASLFGADLRFADLAFTTFHGAFLMEADVYGANLFHVDITSANLSDIQNWEHAQWLTARYNDETVFPEGMYPEDYAMMYMEIPAPSALWLIPVIAITRLRRS
ncbi:MAG: hypothetical protein CMJ38_04780 [Phycisphaerae bacterium]|nr:hypothetical protein [Phycisphaerae bacterium]